MVEDVLKKYSDRVTYYKSVIEPKKNNIWNQYSKEYGETIIQNEHYIMKVSYSDGKISKIEVEIDRTRVEISNNPDSKKHRFNYFIPRNIEEILGRRLLIVVWDDDENEVENGCKNMGYMINCLT